MSVLHSEPDVSSGRLSQSSLLVYHRVVVRRKTSKFFGLGGGEVARYIGRHGTNRVAKAVLIGAVPPLLLKTDANPGGVPKQIFDQIRAGVLADRSQFFMDLTMPFCGYNRPGAKVSQGVCDSFWLQGMMAGMAACYFWIKAFSETDQAEDLKRIDVPTLILHEDDDQIVPIADSTILSAKLTTVRRRVEPATVFLAGLYSSKFHKCTWAAAANF